MPVIVQETPVLNEQIWNAWIQKANLRERATAQKMKVCAGVALGLAAIAYSVFRFAL